MTNPNPASSNAPEFSGTSLYWLACAMRCLYGVVFVLLLNAISRCDLPAFTSTIILAAYTCGLAVGAALDRQVSLLVGRKPAALLSGVFLIAGLLAMQLTDDAAGLACSAFLSGLGCLGDWSSLSSSVRLSFPAFGRWNALRWYHICLPLGMLIGVFFSEEAFAVVVIITALVTSRFLTLSFPTLTENVTRQIAEATSPPKSGEIVPSPGSAALVADQPDPAASVAEECDAVECCGGAAREFQPTSYAHSVVISTAGACLLWGFLPTIILLWPSTGHVAAVASGVLLGQLLLISAAPRVGYAIISMPFLLCSLPSILLPIWVDGVSWLSWCLAFSGGLFAGAAASGVSAMIGELATDCPTDSVRTRIVSSALFATTLIILLAGGLSAIGPRSLAFAVWALLCLVGIIAIRRIPSPVISTLGSDASDEQTDAELKDIVAALNN